MKTAASNILERQGIKTEATGQLPTEAPKMCKKHASPLERVLLFRNNVTEKGVWSPLKCLLCEQEDEAAATKKREDDARESWIARHTAWCGLKGRYLETTFQNFLARTDPQRKVLASCQKFAAQVNADKLSGLWLIGPVGTGKSHLGAAMVHHLIRNRKMYAAMLSTRQLIRELRATWQKGSEFTEEEVIERYGNNVSLLVLDEIGIGFGSESEQTQLFDVLDLRYQLQRPTVLLSNLPSAEISKVLGDRLFDRLREGSRVLVCDWESHR